MSIEKKIKDSVIQVLTSKDIKDKVDYISNEKLISSSSYCLDAILKQLKKDKVIK